MIKKCAYCGKEFETKSGIAKFCKRPHFSDCEICGKSFMIKLGSNPIPKTCSQECRAIQIQRTVLERYGINCALNLPGVHEKGIKAQQIKYQVANVFQCESVREKARRTIQEKYGVDNVSQNPDIMSKIKATFQAKYEVDNALQLPSSKQKAKAVCLEKYGVEYAFQADTVRQDALDKARESILNKYGVNSVFELPEIQAKAKETMRSKYGVEYALQSDEFKKKAKSTSIARYGVEYAIQSTEFKDKAKKTSLERYGVEYPIQNESVKAKRVESNYYNYGVAYPSQLEPQKESAKSTMIQTCQDKYGVPWPCLLPQCLEVSGSMSKVNEEFAKRLQELGIEYEQEFVLEDRSFDFHILGSTILVEIDPTVTHNTVKSPYSGYVIDENYHLMKSDLAKKHGYRCIHIFDWEDKHKIIKSLLVKPDTFIYARKCKVKPVDQYTADVFTEKYHMQGKCRGQKNNVGLYYNNELVEIMTFGKPRYNRKYQYELLRLCSKQGVRVPGGASKLFKHFVTTQNPESIISYCNLSKFTGDVYEKIGMTLDNVSAPNKIWSKDSQYITNNFMLQRGFDQLFNAHYGRGTSNDELILAEGWLPVYDCGQAVYGWRK